MRMPCLGCGVAIGYHDAGCASRTCRHVRLRSKSKMTVEDTKVTVLEVCRCGAHRNVTVDAGKVERGEWG